MISFAEEAPTSAASFGVVSSCAGLRVPRDVAGYRNTNLH